MAADDFETRLDYTTRTDDQPVYVGEASRGTATNIKAWNVQRYEYDGTNRVTRVQTLEGITWDDRAAAAWT